jgi:hypothetical protein
MVWMCREVHPGDPDFEEKGGEDEESMREFMCGVTLQRSDMLLLTVFVALGAVQFVESILYYWRML